MWSFGTQALPSDARTPVLRALCGRKVTISAAVTDRGAGSTYAIAGYVNDAPLYTPEQVTPIMTVL